MLCLGCMSSKNGKKNVYAYRKDDNDSVIYVPPIDEHVCEFRDSASVKNQQKITGNKKRGRSGDDDYNGEESARSKRVRRSLRTE